MPAGDLDQHSPAKTSRFYFDTSAIIAAGTFEAKAAGRPVSAIDLGRGTKLVRFAAKVRRLQATMLTTLLALEEMAAHSRRTGRDAAARKNGHSHWGEFKSKGRPQEVSREDDAARLLAVQMVGYAIKQMATLGVQLDGIDTAGGPAAAIAGGIQAKWLAMLQGYSIDPMDALHICVGNAMAATHFVSFDKGWDLIPSITVLR